LPQESLRLVGVLPLFLILSEKIFFYLKVKTIDSFYKENCWTVDSVSCEAKICHGEWHIPYKTLKILFCKHVFCISRLSLTSKLTNLSLARECFAISRLIL
jgi:hypothetical protein